AQILQGVDNGQGGVGPWTSGGAPGIGFFDSADNNWSNFGFSSFTGSDSAANVDGGRDAGSPPPDAGSPPPDAGSGRPDGGSGRPDAGGDSGTRVAASGSSSPDASTPTPDGGMSNVTGGGCGCSGTGGQLAVALALLCLLRRSRTRHARVLG